MQVPKARGLEQVPRQGLAAALHCGLPWRLMFAFFFVLADEKDLRGPESRTEGSLIRLSLHPTPRLDQGPVGGRVWCDAFKKGLRSLATRSAALTSHLLSRSLRGDRRLCPRAWIGCRLSAVSCRAAGWARTSEWRPSTPNLP